MRPLVLLTLIGLLAGTAAPVAGQEWIARVKSAPQDFRDRNFRIDGEVLEVRGATAISSQGLYRLSDGSDPIGVLIRTTDLPQTSGPFEITARLSPELLYEGSLLLDEVRRRDPFAWQAVAPLVIAVLGLLLLVLYAVRYTRARQRERHQHLAPPMWLIPTDKDEGALPAETGGGQVPAVRFNYRLQYIEQERSAALERTKRTSLRGVAGAGAITLASMAWFLIGVEEATGRPTFVLLGPVLEALGPRPDSALTELPADTAALTLAIQPPGGPAATRPAERPPVRSPVRPPVDSPPRRAQPPAVRTETTATPTGPVTTPPAAVVSETTARVVDPPVSPPPPAPPPPVIPPATNTRPDTAPREVARDPAADRAAAASVISSARTRLVAAINRGEIDGIASLFSWTGNEGWKNGFLGHLRSNESTAEAGALDEVSLSEGGVAEASFGVTIRWRANFGVERRKEAQFVGTVRRVGNDWRLSGVRLMQKFP